MGTKPNILLIVVDQFRGDLLGDTKLGRVARLPNLKALMNDAVTFSRHYSVVTPCGPSRVSLMTGQYAMNHRAVRNGTPLRHDTPNLATEVRKGGYEPLLFGYTDTAQDPRVIGTDDPRLQSYEELMPGFSEVVRMRMESDDQAWRDHLASKGIDLPPYPDTYRPIGDKLNDPAIYSAEDSDTAFLTDRFLDFASTADSGWCAALTYVRPHPPFVAPAPYNTMFDPAQMPPPETTGNDRDWHPFMAPAQDKAPPSSTVEGFPDLEASPETTATLRAIYLGLCAEVDHHIGRVVDKLKETGQWDNTLLVVTADHGDMMGDFGLWGKGSFHDAAFHVPLIIRDPSRSDRAGEVVRAMTESIDVTPSILSHIGVPVPHGMDGQSLLPLVENTSAPGKTASFSEYDMADPRKPTQWQKTLGLDLDDANLAILRTDRHHLVQFASDMPPILFDMAREGERAPLAETPETLPLWLQMSQKMLTHRMQNPDGTFSRTLVYDGLHIAKD
ncbi:MAG: sulfatase-like hydrolase/transferase [Silicimonas sp.]|nr:sulfatase-like hydrolase/transferase [Silicimonas sp.]